MPSLHQLQAHLSAISALPDEQVISLEKNERDYIKAKASTDLWEVWKRRGGWWTKQSFSAGLSTEWSERTSRKKFGFRRFFDSREQLRFSTTQMTALFSAHFAGERYPYPYVGAD